MAKLTEEQIKHTAELAKIKLSEDEVKKYTKELGSILEYIEILNEVDTEKIPETSQVTNIENRQRKDEIKPSLSSEEALKNVKKKEDGFIVTER